jgi:hypothetical protein
MPDQNDKPTFWGASANQWSMLVGTIGVPAILVLGGAWYGFPLIADYVRQSGEIQQSNGEAIRQLTVTQAQMGETIVKLHETLRQVAQMQTASAEFEEQVRCEHEAAMEKLEAVHDDVKTIRACVEDEG